MKNKSMQRNKLDIILTDLQPVETPKIYTSKYFYDFLIKSKSIKKIMKCSGDQDKGNISPAWHASPLKYHILKDNNDMRELSYVNPLSMIEVCCFLDEYEKELLDSINTNLFSIRHHKKNNDLYYTKSDNSIVEYEYINADNKRDKIEASGNFYKIEPYKRLDFFYKSQEWFDLNRKYKFFGKIDYNKCFDSIYTHTYNWFITSNVIEAKLFNQKHILSAIDRLLQSMNMSMTNGIVVGPEFSRLLAEILLQNIDSEVYIELNRIGIIKDEDYSIKRYIDDVFIFTNDEENINKIISLITNTAEKYRLHLNNKKKEVGKLPHIWFTWRESVNGYTSSLLQFLFHDVRDEKYGYIIKEKNLMNNNKFSKIKELFQNMLINNMDYNVKVVSYCLSTILNKVANRKYNELKKTIFNKSKDFAIYQLYDLLLYTYSFAATYNNTEKLISIIILIEKEIGKIQSITILKKVAKRYEFIFTNGNDEDIVNLLLLYACDNIKLESNIEQKILDRIYEKNNPMLFATYLIYVQNNIIAKKELIEIIESKIEDAVDEIKNNLKFFLYKQVWWILIFYECPFIDKSIQYKMNNKVIKVKLELKNDIYDTAKSEIINFILDTNNKIKFINWHLEKDEFYEKVIFKTLERTIFNSKNNNYTADDFDY